MDTGRLAWSKQLTPQDGWNFACVMGGGQNCPQQAGPDHDIGASPILRTLSNGKRLLLVGQKSGFVHALDPDAQGAIVWQTRVAQGSALGGVEWGMAADSNALYVPISDHLTKRPGGLAALRLTDGAKLWRIDGATPECAGRKPCNPAQQAAPTLIPGAVFSGSMDGKLRAHSTRDGSLLWSYDALQQPGGGSINVSSAIVAQGMLIVPSGYGILGGLPGNVVLTFTVDAR
jgi:polyvinyl alcohol dehydrogenase (cytochrome)